jgi:Zn-dependent protease/predicted transcriptional regulator
MIGASWRLGRIAGIEIRIDSSWAVLAILITYTMYVQLTVSFPRLGTGPAVGVAILAAVLFFASVLLHELAHAVVSRARGIPVRDITLFLFGGATRARLEAGSPGDEFLITVVGPLTSIVLAGVFFGLSLVARGAPARIGPTLAYLAVVNLFLAAFNLLPGFPLDGGRLLRSIVWKITGSLNRATRIASSVGQAIGYLMIAAGVVALLAGAPISGIWLAAIGWFLAQAARASYRDLEIRRLLHQADAEDVMTVDLKRVPHDVTVRDAVDRFFMRYDHGGFPVEQDGRTIGLLTLRAVKRLPREEWDERRVRDVMAPIGDEVTVSPDTPMDQVVEKLEAADGSRVLVVSDGEVVGIITPTDVARWVSRREELAAPAERTEERWAA